MTWIIRSLKTENSVAKENKYETMIISDSVALEADIRWFLIITYEFTIQVSLNIWAEWFKHQFVADLNHSTTKKNSEYGF